MSGSVSPVPIALDSFARRQFTDPSYAGTKLHVSESAFMSKVLLYYTERKRLEDDFHDRPALVDGYAPFCKHIFMPNFMPDVKDGAVPITPDNEHLLRSKYEARKEGELPVLIRYFRAEDVHLPVSRFLDLILYSREQIAKEHEATGTSEDLGPAPWRLISVKGQAVPYEIPMYVHTRLRYLRVAGSERMLAFAGLTGVEVCRRARERARRNPITMMRNEMISQGGSGVPVDREAYMKSVEYWKDHATVI